MSEVIAWMEKFSDAGLIVTNVEGHINRFNLLVRDIFWRLEYSDLVDLLTAERDRNS